MKTENFRLTRKTQSGFTLLEMMMTVAILVVVSALGLVAMRSSYSASDLASHQRDVQACVRDTLAALTAELQLSSKTTRAVDNVAALRAPTADEVVFQIPLDNTGKNWSAPITYQYVNEDLPGQDGKRNALLDAGEDTDGDGLLSRRVLRIAGEEQSIFAAANSLSDVQFSLNSAGDILTITVTATKALDPKGTRLASATATARVKLLN